MCQSTVAGRGAVGASEGLTMNRRTKEVHANATLSLFISLFSFGGVEIDVLLLIHTPTESPKSSIMKRFKSKYALTPCR